MSTEDTIGIVGTGTMGAGIAQVTALAKKRVIAIDVTEEALNRAKQSISRSLTRLVGKGTLSSSDADAAADIITYSTEYATLSEADVLIEAATENVDVKRSILSRMSEVAKPSAVIATNTSSLSVTLLSTNTRDSSRFVGMHFFNPVALMPLVEIVRGLATTDGTCARAEQFVKEIGKTPVMVANSPGFVVNRLLVPMINEAFFLLGEGVASAEQIDEAMKLGANHPMGPLALGDLIGLDVCLAVMQVLENDFGDSKYRPALRLREFVAAGRLGRKSGRGVYSYDSPKRASAAGGA